MLFVHQLRNLLTDFYDAINICSHLPAGGFACFQNLITNHCYQSSIIHLAKLLQRMDTVWLRWLGVAQTTNQEATKAMAGMFDPRPAEGPKTAVSINLLTTIIDRWPTTPKRQYRGYFIINEHGEMEFSIGAGIIYDDLHIKCACWYAELLKRTSKLERKWIACFNLTLINNWTAMLYALSFECFLRQFGSCLLASYLKSLLMLFWQRRFENFHYHHMILVRIHFPTRIWG